MRTQTAVIIAAGLSLLCCDKKMGPPPPPIPHATLKGSPPLTVPASQQRALLRDAYRLRPDYRFLLAFGEIRRLADRKSGATAAPAPARVAFERGRWTLRVAGSDVGSVPELPDFSDFLPPLVAYAKKTLPDPVPRTGRDRDLNTSFLMPRLVDAIRSAEPGVTSAIPAATRVFARLAFQLQDRLELAPVLHARALALLAAERASDPSGGLEEEALLAHALGYTRHAEAVAARLPADSPVRLFETRDDESLRRVASRPDASEESRYLLLRRTVTEGDLTRWKDDRQRFFPNDNSISVVGTAYDLPLPQQNEVAGTREVLIDALPRGAIRELSGGQVPEADEDPNLRFGPRLDSAAGSLHGALWDQPAMTAYYEAIFYSTLDPEYRSDYERPSLPDRLLSRLGGQRGSMPPPPDIPDGRGIPIFAAAAGDALRPLQIGDPRASAIIRELMRRLDSRPAHRARLARLSHYTLTDPRAAEDLHRSLLLVLGDSSGQQKSESGIYAGDWTTVERTLRSSSCGARETVAVLRNWFSSFGDPQRLDREYQRAIAKFPAEWDLTNSYVDFLRSRSEFASACRIVERWMKRNPDPHTPGYLHAPLRLGHGYVLAYEYEKSRGLMEGWSRPIDIWRDVERPYLRKL